MPKFKVGDRVRGIKAQDGNTKVIGTRGTVLYVLPNGDAAIRFDMDIAGHSCSSQCKYGHGWYCRPDALALDISNTAKVIIFTQGNKVIAKILKDKKVIGIASATCSPDDEFNLLTGAQIALARLGKQCDVKPVLLKETLNKALENFEII